MMRLPSLTIIACIAILAGPASAESYNLSSANTSVSFTTHWGLFRPQGAFGHVAGRLEFTPDRSAQSHVDVTLDMSSLRIGGEVFNERLLGPGFFDVGRYPMASFKSTKVEVTGHGTADMTGDLTLHGVTRKVVMAVTYDNKASGPAYRFAAIAHIRRSDFGLDTYRMLAGDEIELRIETTLLQ